MLNCKQAAKLISESMDRKITVGERIGLWSHLYLCSLCRQFRINLLAMRKLVRRLELNEQPPQNSEPLSAEAKRRIHDAIDRHQ